jgi:hypothetical protein
MDLREIGLEAVKWLGLIWLRIGTGGGLYKHGNEPLGSTEGREFHDHLDVLLASLQGLCSMELVV